MLNQLGAEYVDYARGRDAKFLVAVKQTKQGTSEAWASYVLAIVQPRLRSVLFVDPGGDTWDNPCMCVVGFKHPVEAETCAIMFPRTELRAL
jgi:hypothetical protein